mmetsp:Transcript_22144/g.52442  ORF Transcript_22144/g.52442 Transcript_22144/m.52442 type:complete len:265 (-) Transcript_22144:390-1184(-)
MATLGRPESLPDRQPVFHNLVRLQLAIERGLIQNIGGDVALIDARVEPRGMGATQIGHHGNERRLGPTVRRLGLPPAVEVGQDLDRLVLTQRVDGNDHVGTAGGRGAGLGLGLRGGYITPTLRSEGSAPAQTLLERLEAERVEKELVQDQPERRGAKVVEPIPQEGVGRHDLVRRHVLVVGEGPVVGVDVDDVDLELGGVQGREGVAEGVGGGAVAAAGVRHEDLDGVRRRDGHVLSTGGGTEDGTGWSTTRGGVRLQMPMAVT